MPEKDLIDILIDKVYQLFNEHSIYEVMDMDKETARARMIDLYEPSDDETVLK